MNRESANTGTAYSRSSTLSAATRASMLRLVHAATPAASAAAQAAAKPARAHTRNAAGHPLADHAGTGCTLAMIRASSRSQNAGSCGAGYASRSRRDTSADVGGRPFDRRRRCPAKRARRDISASSRNFAQRPQSAAQRESSVEQIGPSSPLRNAEEPPNLAVPKALHVMEHDDRALTIGQQVQRFG